MPKNFEGRGKGSLLAESFILLSNECGKYQKRVASSHQHKAISNPAQLVINAAVFDVKKLFVDFEALTMDVQIICLTFRCVENCFSTSIHAAFPNRLRFPASRDAHAGMS
jgi:hypothetical protein